MVYFFFIVLAVSVAFVFYSSTRQYRDWGSIKDSWFRSGIDNSMLFSSEREPNGSETARLDGEYNDCAVTLSTTKGDRSHSIVSVSYPSALKERLRSYPDALVERIDEILKNNGFSSTGEEAYLHLYVEGKALRKRLHPHLAEQLVEIGRQYVGRGGRFEVSKTEMRFIRDGLLSDPSQLFPILDEMVAAVNLMVENIDHLLVQ